MMKFRNFLGEFRVEVGLGAQPFEPRDLLFLARRVGRRQVVFGLQPAHRLRVLEAFGQRVDEDRVQPVDALAMFTAAARPRGRVSRCIPVSLLAPACAFACAPAAAMAIDQHPSVGPRRASAPAGPARAQPLGQRARLRMLPALRYS